MTGSSFTVDSETSCDIVARACVYRENSNKRQTISLLKVK